MVDYCLQIANITRNFPCSLYLKDKTTKYLKSMSSFESFTLRLQRKSWQLNNIQEMLIHTVLLKDIISSSGYILNIIVAIYISCLSKYCPGHIILTFVKVQGHCLVIYISSLSKYCPGHIILIFVKVQGHCLVNHKSICKTFTMEGYGKSA